jgi:hypothetical protein
MSFDVYFPRVPVFEPAPDEIAAFQNQNPFARRREFMQQRAAARARADDYKIVMSVRHKNS